MQDDVHSSSHIIFKCTLNIHCVVSLCSAVEKLPPVLSKCFLSHTLVIESITISSVLNPTLSLSIYSELACSFFTRHTSCAPGSESVACLWLSCQLATRDLSSLSLPMCFSLTVPCCCVVLSQPCPLVLLSVILTLYYCPLTQCLPHLSLSLSLPTHPSCNMAQLWVLTLQPPDSYITGMMLTSTTGVNSHFSSNMH